MRLTEKNKKRILWAAVLIIVPSFALWGSMALRDGDERVAGEISGRSIRQTDFLPYIEQARLHWLLNLEQHQEASRQDMYSLAGNFYLLDYQAKRENIEISDQEVINYIQDMPFFQENDRFNAERYQMLMNYIQRRFGQRFTARNFEEYVRSIIRREKLFAKHINVEISPEQVKEAYIIENQKAKISYLFIPYQALKPVARISSEALKEFYLENKNIFQKKPKIKARYISLEPESEKAQAIMQKLPKVASLEEIDGVEIFETGFFAKDQPIKGVGFNPRVNQILFTLSRGNISPALNIRDEIFVFQKIEEKEASIPQFSLIKEEVEEAYRQKQAEELAQEVAENIIQEITTADKKDLSAYDSREKVKFKKTDFFKYFDYIQGLGLSQKVGDLVFFELKPGQIYPKPVFKENGIYILKLEEKTEIDSEEFAQEKDQYYRFLKEQRESFKRHNYLNQLQRDLSFRLQLTRQ